MLDFRDPGDRGVFIDEQGVAKREQTIGQGGIYAGSELGFVFQTLRANDLIWPNVINNYLKGKSPEAFDLLYWNADATNLPGPMYAWYLRNLYLENNLRVPGKLTMCGTPDLGDIDMPSYVLATQEDHIVPWHSAYHTTQLVGGKSQFVLAAAAVICSLSRPSVMVAKEAVNRAFEAPLAEGVRFERRLFHSLFGTADQREGMAAFLAKRKPAFEHR